MKKLVRHARVLVTDGARAIVLRNEGDAAHPDLKTVRAYAQENLPSHELGAHKPFRTNDSQGHRSAMDAPDWHRLAEDRFVDGIAAAMDHDLKAGEYETLIVVGVTKVTVLELDKDLTKHPSAEIAKLVMKALEGA
jgi:protein required for attachment to host cells